MEMTSSGTRPACSRDTETDDGELDYIIHIIIQARFERTPGCRDATSVRANPIGHYASSQSGCP